MKNWIVKNKLIFILTSIILFYMLLTGFLLHNQEVSDYKIKDLYENDYHAASDLAVIRCAVKPRPSCRGYKARFFP